MILDLHQNIGESKDCKTFYFFDTTPLYNAISAPNGYDPTGVDSVDPADIDQGLSELVVTLPDGTEVHFDMETYGDYDETRLTTDGKNLFQFSISYSDLGFDSTLADGIYKFHYIIYVGDGDALPTYQTISYVVQDCAACCCLDEKLAAIKYCRDCKENKDIKELYDLYLKRCAAKILAACGDYQGAQVALDYITDACAIKKCNGC